MGAMTHMKYMIIGGAGAFGIALIAGVPAQTALSFAFIVACPLMMVFMMSGSHEHGQMSHRRGDEAESPRDTTRARAPGSDSWPPTAS